MKKTLIFTMEPILHNSPRLKRAKSTLPDLRQRTSNTAQFFGLIENTPKLKAAEVLEILVAV
tara:strand:- start:7703 stop:7888 length:186 start_codon:yes stop_codon:yes gene_type:complete